jgi:membrane-bound lytic murein transglycosylase B
MRFILSAAFYGLFLVSLSTPAFAAAGFDEWLRGVRQEATQRGISSETASKALSGLRHLDRVIELDRKQPEKRLSMDEYLRKVINNARIEKGRAMMAAHRGTLNKISAQYGVPAQYIVALWGLETSYGNNTGNFDVIEALATLAYDGRRSAYFREELFKALKILDEGHISHAAMKGSWAGAMGQNQFMPSSFFAFAVDGNGDGRRDIWTDEVDVFASTANYLSKSGWNKNQRWGREVIMTQVIPKDMLGMDVKKALAEWRRMGIRLSGGGELPTNESIAASLIAPDGRSGPAFLAYDNFRVIMKWNKSTYFASSVGLLADEISR